MTIIVGSLTSHDPALVMVLKANLEPGSLRCPPFQCTHGSWKDGRQVRGLVVSSFQCFLVWVRGKTAHTEEVWFGEMPGAHYCLAVSPEKKMLIFLQYYRKTNIQSTGEKKKTMLSMLLSWEDTPSILKALGLISRTSKTR